MKSRAPSSAYFFKEVIDQLFLKYKEISIANLRRTSRTAQDGTIDVSAAESPIPENCLPVFELLNLKAIPALCYENFKQLNLNQAQFEALINSNEKIKSLNVMSLMNKTQEDIKCLVISNYEAALDECFNVAKQNPGLLELKDIKDFIIKIIHILGKDIINEKQWLREHNSSKYPVYTQVENLSDAFDDFIYEFYQKYQNLLACEDPAVCLSATIEMAAWIEYRFNLTDHFAADSCGKVAALLGNFIFMSAKIHPDYWPTIDRQSYFDKRFLPGTRRNTDPKCELREYEIWCEHYRSAFFHKDMKDLSASSPKRFH